MKQPFARNGFFPLVLSLYAVLLSSAAVQAQNIYVSPKLIRFPDQGIHSTSASYTITLWNNQKGSLSITSILVPAPYAETNNCGNTVAPDAKCTITVTFTPTTVKYYSTTLTITDSAGNSPQVITLTGNGIKPVKFTPVVGGYYFVHQLVNTPSTPQVVTLTNEQSVPLAFSGIGSAAEFPFTTNCGNGRGGGSLAPGTTCTVLVTFHPAQVATYNAALTINNNAYGSPIVIPLTGTGISNAPSPTISVTPATPCVGPSESQQFSTAFIGTAASPVNWYVDGIHSGNADVGVITATGRYTAPAWDGTHVIRAVSQTKTSLAGSASLTVTPKPGFELYPYVAPVAPGGRQQFAAQICQATDNHQVTYAVDGIVGGNSSVGTITPQGLYTAPTTAGKHIVKLTDPVINKSTSGQVTVFSGITADFASRANNTAAVPANMFGYGRAESLRTTSDRNLVTEAGVTEARLSAQISSVFATSTPNWTKIDPLISTIQAAGQHAMLQLKETPPWLEPSTGGCRGQSYAAPSDVNSWAEMAAEYVAHMDAAFPGVVTDYEIWNEPNEAALCATDRLSTYLSMYAAAAPAMKAQAARDGRTIRVGGPVLSGFNAQWITSLLTNPSTAPYVDFVSYHQYFYGTVGLNAAWDKYNGRMSVYEATQDPNIGAQGVYARVQSLVAQGKQPGHAQTPVYVTEYNSNWAFFQDCCKNNPTYAPVFNELYLTDMLNTIYEGQSKMPARLFYFAGSAYPYFCLIGVKDSNNDCLYSSGATPVPYPQYYAFDLLASPSYLGLSAGGHMARYISPNSGGGGLVITAFYTASQDAIVITNPTSTAYPQLSVTFENPGLSATQGMLYSIVDGEKIDSDPISFAVKGSSRTATISIPAYSVQGISLK